MKLFGTILIAILFNMVAQSQESSTRLNDLSADLFYAIRIDQPHDEFKTELENTTFQAVTDSLKSDAQKKAFWINVYNAYTQLRLRTNPQTYRNRGKFFRTKFIKIGGVELSLNDIEHRILRRQHALLGGGYFRNIFKKKFANAWQVDSLDHRIHFALNCGAASCPPIAFYEPETIDQDLSEAQQGYLSTQLTVNKKEQVVKAPKLFSWYRGDFGGKKGALKLFEDLGFIEQPGDYKLKFKPYDWTLQNENYAEDE